MKNGFVTKKKYIRKIEKLDEDQLSFPETKINDGGKNIILCAVGWTQHNRLRVVKSE